MSQQNSHTRFAEAADGGDMPRREEQRCIERAKRGDAEAFRTLVETYQERLYAFVWRVVRNHHEAEDLCQAAFVKAYQSLASYRREYAFSTWLYTIAYRLSLNLLRKRKRQTGEFDSTRLQATDPPPDETLAESEDARRLKHMIWQAVEELTPAQRACITLFYRESQSCQAIGSVLGIPAVTVKSHLHRAREKLAKRLRSADVSDSSLQRVMRTA